jgi:hypothetical protein
MAARATGSDAKIVYNNTLIIYNRPPLPSTGWHIVAFRLTSRARGKHTWPSFMESSMARDAARRPLSVTLVALILAASGVVGLVYHGSELTANTPVVSEEYGVLLLRVVAIVTGVFLFRGAKWARWLALAWIGFHVIISVPDVSKTLTHVVILAIFAVVLFSRNSRTWFHGGWLRNREGDAVKRPDA